MGDSEKKVTIYDIASRANVSISTVSRVFNGNPSVSRKTRKKVEKIIEELHYIPNALARGLAHQSSRTVGLIVSDISNPFFADTINGIESILYNEGFTILLSNTYYSAEKEEMYITQMLEKRVEGMIIFSAYPQDNRWIERAKNIVPVISVQSALKGLDCVNTTDEDGAYEAVDYLIKLGHKNIAFLVYDYKTSTIIDRMKGYIKAHKNNGLTVNKDYIIASKFTPCCGYYMTRELLEKYPEVTAIFAHNDKIALDAYLAVQSKGLKIPEDISIVGYDDIETASLVRPKLTTVSQPFYEIGRNAAELLLKRIKDNKWSTHQTILLPTKLVIRESAASPQHS